MSLDLLRNLPTKGTALTGIRTGLSEVARPPRKTPRKDHSTSASQAFQASAREGPERISLHSITARPLPLSFTAGLGPKVKRWIGEILSHEEIPSTTSYETIFNAGQILVCVLGQGAKVYEDLRESLGNCLAEMAQRLHTHFRESLSWLRQLLTSWNWISRKIVILRSVLVFVDRYHVPAHKDLLPIEYLALDLFTDKLFGNIALTEKLETEIKMWLHLERSQSKPHPERETLIVPIVAALTKLGVYNSHFEAPYLDSTAAFYGELCTSLSAGDSAEFIRQCTFRIDEEVDRAKTVLSEPSRDEVLNVTKQNLFLPKVNWLAETGIPILMDNRNYEGLKRLYRLLAQVSALEPLRKAFQAYVHNGVKLIVGDSEKDENMVASLIDFKGFVDSVLSAQAFDERDRDIRATFVDAYKSAFKAAFTLRHSKPAEMIAKYIDAAMRRGHKGTTDAAFQSSLNGALALHPFTPDKDVFRTFYNRSFAKRLLLQRSASDDDEKNLIAKLKAYDPAFGDGEKMFADLRQSKDLADKFRSSRGRTTSDLTLTAMVLQNSVWPIYIPVKVGEDNRGQTKVEVAPVDLPASMQAALSNYESFYQKERPTRRLQWVHALGTVTLDAQFPGGNKTLSVSLFQAVVLLLFNENERLGYDDIKSRTGLNEGELMRTLQSLACGKKKILLKAPTGRDINPTDEFVYNAGFTDPRITLHINSIQQAETAEENRQITQAIDQDRHYHLDAAIVRIMKAKKSMMHEILLAATIDAVKNHFVPAVGDIKKQIDSLIAKEYLTRDSKIKSLYHYVA